MKRRASSQSPLHEDSSKRASPVAFLNEAEAEAEAEAKASQEVSSKRYGPTSPFSSPFLDRAPSSEGLFGQGGFLRKMLGKALSQGSIF